MAADKRVLGMYSTGGAGNQPGQIAAGDTALVGVGIKQSVAAVQLTIGSGLGDVFIDTGAPGAPGVPSLKKLIVSADMDVNGIETVIGNTIFESNIQLGDAPADYITFVGMVGDPLNTSNDIVFEPVNAHQILIAPPAAPGAGQNLSIYSADANGANPAGSLVIDTGTGTSGSMFIGDTRATQIIIGRTGQITYLNGSNTLGLASTDYTVMTGYIDSNITFRHIVGFRTISPIAAPAGAAGTGLALWAGDATAPGNFSGGQISIDSGAPSGTSTGSLIGIGTGGNAREIYLATGVGTNRLIFDNLGAITVQAGAILGTTGTGNINLPVNVSAKFQIEGAPVSGTNLTAANFDQMWDGSVVPASLHTHAGLASGTIETTETSLSALARGMAVRLTFSGAFRRVDTQDATDDTSLNAFTFGLAKATILLPGSVNLICFGPCPTDDAAWDAAPVVADVGKPVYGSTTTVGKLSLAPSDSAGWTTRIGYVYFASLVVDTAVVFVQPGEVINNNPP